MSELTEAPAASVVIPTRDRRDDLRRVLAAIARQRTKRPFEVVVVDDGGEPPLEDSIVAGVTAGRLVRGEGRGPAAARNLGVAVARADVVLFTDDDTEPAETWVEAALRFLDEHPDHAGVEGPTTSPRFDPLYEHSIERDAPGGYVTANMGYRHDVLERIGGFSEDYPSPHCEDLDLAYRASRLGELGFAPGMVVLHHPRPLALADFRRRARMTASEALLFERHRERFGRAARMPARLFPVASVAYGWWLGLRREGLGLLRSPRRLARFALAAANSLGTVVATTLRPR